MSTFLSTWVGLGDEAHLAVTVAGDAAEAASRLTESIVADKVASRIAGGDPTLWGPSRRQTRRDRLGWVHFPESSREILGELDDLSCRLRAEGMTASCLPGWAGPRSVPRSSAPPTAFRL